MLKLKGLFILVLAGTCAACANVTPYYYYRPWQNWFSPRRGPIIQPRAPGITPGASVGGLRIIIRRLGIPLSQPQRPIAMKTPSRRLLRRSRLGSRRLL